MQDREVTPTPAVDFTRAHQTRAVNYLLGGKDNFEVDRAEIDASKTDPRLLRRMARAHVQFRQRVVRHLAADAGIRQFLNFDCGFPHGLDLHEIAQKIDPTARVVYVSVDPVVAAHCRALLTSDPQGAVRFVLGDARQMANLLDDPELSATLDLDRPLAVTLSSSLMTLSDARARAELGVLRAAVAPGSHLALSQLTADFDPDEIAHTIEELSNRGVRCPTRTRAQLTTLFDGWDLAEPGVGSILDWRPSIRDAQRAENGDRRAQEVHIMGGVARTPCAGRD